MLTTHFSAWAHAGIIQMKHRVQDRLTRARREDGAVTLEYVVIGAAIFVAAVALIGLIVNEIRDRQADIAP